MKRPTFRTALAAVVLLAGTLVFSGCGDKESKFYGTYESSAGKLEIKPEHKGTLTVMGAAGEITWETDKNADDKIIVHALIAMGMFRNSDGSLRDEQGITWKKK